MLVFSHKNLLQQALQQHHKTGTVGFVPTMGALHEGHLSLIKNALSENELVVVSIFVNPTQFNNPSDLEKYPRTLEADLDLLKTLKGNLMVFAPETSELYSGKAIAKKYDLNGLAREMEGRHRKNHFDGVATVLALFFEIVKPDRAYFGEKDFQQLQIVKKLVEIENLPVEIIGCPTLREANGLAMSSRNKRLSAEHFEEAALIYKTLSEVKENFSRLSIPQLKTLVENRFQNNALLQIEYFEIADAATLEPADGKMPAAEYRAFIAVQAGEVRLIDNVALN